VRSILLTILSVVGQAFLAFGQGHSTGFVLDRGDMIEDILLQYYDEYNFNGSVLVAERGEIIYQNTFGLADFSEELPLDSHTPFYLASVSKQFTAAGVMKLQEMGKLSIDDPITKYLTLMPNVYTRVTIRHLLNHTGGLPDYLSASYVAPGTTNLDVYNSLITKKKLLFEPGSKYRYSNSGYVILAMIIEVAAGKRIDKFYREKIFEPLKMYNTFVFTPANNTTYRAFGYSIKQRNDDYDLLTIGDGGFYSTSMDLFIWLEALNSGRVLTEKSIQTMYTPVTMTSGRIKRYGFGWELGSNLNGPLVYHTGELAGFRTYIERQLTTDATIIILTNNSFSQMNSLRNVLVKVLDGRLTSLPDN